MEILTVRLLLLLLCCLISLDPSCCGSTSLRKKDKFERLIHSLDPSPKPTKMQLRLFYDDDHHSNNTREFVNNAICNDGTSGGYYFSESTSYSLNNTYLIYLRGGGQCYDEVSCSQRWIESPSLMSSKFFTESIELSGIFDSNPAISPSFWGSKKFALAYCSSDGYIGDIGATNATFG
eukprot:gene1735-2340_t